MVGSSFRSTLAAIGFAASPALAGAQHDTHDKAALGTVRFPVSCAPAVQAGFNRAVALLHHMTYPQARTAFQKVATTDLLLLFSKIHDEYIPS